MSLTVSICCRVHLYAEGIQQLIKDDDEVQILGVADNDDDIRNLMQYHPNVVITDLESSRTALEALNGNEESKVLVVNDDDLHDEDLKHMIAGGLRGILPKSANSKLLLKAIKKLHEGELWLDNQTVQNVLSLREEKKREIRLTKKEVEILNCICNGLTNKEIAKKLYISEQTVKSHCNHLFKKFGVKNRLKLALTAPQCHPESLNRNLQ